MWATFTCEQCFQEYDSEDDFVSCSGDACHEIVCKSCAKPCKNPECKRWVCSNCLEGQSKQYCGEYCIKCAMWSVSKKDEWDWKNFDFVKRGMTHKEGLSFLKKYPTGRKTSVRR